jgi:drug/metabolite transporter (DMT)-like permease
MDHWIKFGLVAAVLVAISDLFRKYLVDRIDPALTVLIPLSIAGTLAIIILLTNGYNGDIKKIETKDLCLLGIIGFMVPIGHYIITKTLQGVHNPGYAKTIISLNVLISSIASLYFFKDAKLNKYTACGIVLVLGGTYLITTNV